MQGNPRLGRAEVGPAAGRICHRAAGLPVARVTCSLPAARQRPGRPAPVRLPHGRKGAGIRTLSSAPPGVPGFPAPTARKRMCRCTCRSLTATAAQEHYRQATGLGLSPVTVLRCQGHPGNAAGPAHPPSGVLRPGTRAISVRLHRTEPGTGPRRLGPSPCPASPPGPRRRRPAHWRRPCPSRRSQQDPGRTPHRGPPVPIELNPTVAWTSAHRGDTYRLMERYDEALASYSRAIELNRPHIDRLAPWASPARVGEWPGCGRSPRPR